MTEFVSLVPVGPNTGSNLQMILTSSVYNAALFPGTTKEAQISAAIDAARIAGVKYVFIPQSMQPFTTSSVVFSTVVKMICEGGNFTDWDVRAYGAAGDGVTDDHFAIQKASDHCPNGGNIHLAAGYNFKITTGVTLSGTGKRMSGGGTITFGAFAALTVQDSGAVETNGCLIEDLKFDGQNTALGTAILVTNVAADCLETQIRHCDIRNAPYGVRATIGFGGGPHEVYVFDSYFQAQDLANSIAISFEAGDCIASRNRIRGYNTGVKIATGSHRICDNHFYKFPSASTAYSIDASQTVVAANRLAIIGNEFDGSPTVAYLALAAFNTRDTTVMGNIFLADPAAGPCISFNAAAGSTNLNRFTITGNTFYSISASKNNVFAMDGNIVTNGSAFLCVKNNTYFQCGVSSFWSTDVADVFTEANQAGPNYTPVPLVGGCTKIATLTGNITLKNPVNATAGGIGVRVTYIFIQDGTGGRTVTLDTQYKGLTWSNAGNTLGKQSSVTFEFDGTNWNAVTPQAVWA